MLAMERKAETVQASADETAQKQRKNGESHNIPKDQILKGGVSSEVSVGNQQMKKGTGSRRLAAE